MTLWIYCIIGWYIIGFLSLMIGNYLFEKRKTICFKDFFISLFGLFMLLCLVLCILFRIPDYISNKWNNVVFDFGKKK
jgi:hypothetical protein